MKLKSDEQNEQLKRDQDQVVLLVSLFSGIFWKCLFIGNFSLSAGGGK